MRPFRALSADVGLFLILRPPPRSTLFPCTTLFRSRARRPQGVEHGRGDRGQQRCVVARRRHVERPSRHALAQWRTDRKSTRLNSSHANISYAVFCLIKKTGLISRNITRLHYIHATL